MKNFRTRLLIALISLMITILVGLAIFLGQLFKSYYLDSYNERLQKESNLLSLYIEDRGGISKITDEDIKEISTLISARVAITDYEGKILHDSGYETQSKLKGLKSIIEEVTQERPNQNTKLVEREDFDLYYSWRSIEWNGMQEGYFFIISRTDELKEAYGQIWWILSISLGIALIAFIYLGFKITSRFTKPIESATNVAIELAHGNYRARSVSNDMIETGMLSTSINILAQNLEEMKKSQEMQQDRMNALIQNMGAGLLLIDSRGYINLVNKGYIDIFQINPAEYIYHLYYEVIEETQVNDLIAEVFRTEQKVSKTLLLPIGIERRYFVVYGIPIIGINNVWKGVLLVFHDITEMKKLEQVRKDFVANVSHELKTPVTSIKGFTETLLDGAMNHKETLKDFLLIINKESDRLQSLIQDLLELSKIEHQEFILHTQNVNIVLLLNDVITMLTKKAEAKDILLEFESIKDEIYIEGDLNRLKQVFINIIGNAILYTPAKGLVRVSITEMERKIQVHVKDTGVGIEAKEIPRIFERFYRVDRARSRESGGTGLGLAIVKHLVEAHHGNIMVKSKMGEGSEFIIELQKYLK